MTAELKYLALVAIFTALMWLPYVLNVIMVRGVVDAMGYPDNPKPLAPWASRMKAAHYNAVENLVVFAVLVLIAHEAPIILQRVFLGAHAAFRQLCLRRACGAYAGLYCRCGLPVDDCLADSGVNNSRLNRGDHMPAESPAHDESRTACHHCSDCLPVMAVVPPLVLSRTHAT